MIMSRQVDNDGSSSEFFCRIPSLPDFDRTFSLEHTKRHEVVVIPDFNRAAGPASELPMLFSKAGPSLPYLDGNREESMRRPSESRGRFSLHDHGLCIRNPRNFESHESTPRELLDATRQREIIATRPTPIYPRGLTEAKIASRRPVCYHETPSRTSMETYSSPPCEVTPYIHSNVDSPHGGFQIQNNLFIPIRDADSEFLAKEEPLLPRTRLDSNTATAATPPPRLTLRPRGKQTKSLAIGSFFL